MTREALAEREKLAIRIYRECVSRAYPEAEVTFNHSRCVELLAVCANEALERAAQAATDLCHQNESERDGILIQAAMAIRALKAEG